MAGRPQPWLLRGRGRSWPVTLLGGCIPNKELGGGGLRALPQVARRGCCPAGWALGRRPSLSHPVIRATAQLASLHRRALLAKRWAPRKRGA